MKWILCILLFLTSYAYANNVLTTEKELNLVKGQEFQVPKGAIGAYALSNDKLIAITQANGKVLLKAKAVGSAVVQVLHNDGTITNYKLKVQANKENAYFSRNSLYRGYNFIFTTEYLSFKSSNQSNIQSSRYRGRALLTTKVGTQGKFLGQIEFRELYPTYFYVRGDFKKAYVGYGDLMLQLNPYRPSFINQPRLRQHTVGWDGEDFDLDLWSGQLSPIPFSNNTLGLGVTNENRSILINDINNRFSGSRFKYKFKGGSSLYGSTWYNHEAKKTIPYLGYTYVNPKLRINNSTTVGNTQEAPVFANKFNYRANKNNWTLQSFTFDYVYAVKGFDNLLFETKLPYERLSTQAQFFSGNKFTSKGSSFLNMGYGYTLNGFTTNKQYSSSVGWKNSNVDLKLDGSMGQQEFSYLPGQVFNNWRYSPGFDLWISPAKKDLRYKLGVEQSYANFEFINGTNKTQETTLRVSAKHKNGLALSLGLGRFNVATPNSERNGVRITPRIDYRKDNVVLYAQGNVTYIDNKLPTEQESAYILGQERYSGGLKYTYNQKHIFEGRFIRASDGINNRDYSSLIVGYTLKLGHPTKSVLSILDSKKVEGVIFEDLNLNGVQDENEKGVKGIKVVVESDKGDRKTDETDGDGDFKISGLNEEVYYFSTEGNSSYTLANHPGSLNFKMQEGYQVKLPAVKTKNIEVTISGESEEGVYVSVDCKEKEGLNKIPMQVGVKAFVSVPVKNDCTIAVNVLGSNQNISVSPELLRTQELTNNQATFEVKSSKILLGQVFYDKNKNGYYEFGEEIPNVEVVFDKYNIRTDENGIFTTKVKPKDNSVKFLKVKGYRCNLRNPEIEDFSGKKLITISCQK